MSELADETDSKSVALPGVRVRSPPPAKSHQNPIPDSLKISDKEGDCALRCVALIACKLRIPSCDGILFMQFDVIEAGRAGKGHAAKGAPAGKGNLCARVPAGRRIFASRPYAGLLRSD